MGIDHHHCKEIRAEALGQGTEDPAGQRVVHPEHHGEVREEGLRHEILRCPGRLGTPAPVEEIGKGAGVDPLPVLQPGTRGEPGGKGQAAGVAHAALFQPPGQLGPEQVIGI